MRGPELPNHSRYFQPFSARTFHCHSFGITFDLWQLSPSSPLAEAVDVRLPREKKLQKTHALILASLADTQQHQILLQPGFRHEVIGDLPVIGKSLDGMFGIIVVPGNAVVVQEGEQFVPVLQQPFLVAFSHFRAVHLLGQSAEELVNFTTVFPEMPLLQTIAINGRNDPSYKTAEIGSDGLEFLVPRIGSEILIEVANEMDQTFLLLAWQRVVSGIEVGDEYALEALEQVVQEIRLPRWPVQVDNFLQVREDPDIPFANYPDVDFGLVSVDEWTGRDPLQEALVGSLIVRSE
jgi:hypothetical protein